MSDKETANPVRQFILCRDCGASKFDTCRRYPVKAYPGGISGWPFSANDDVYGCCDGFPSVAEIYKDDEIRRLRTELRKQVFASKVVYDREVYDRAKAEDPDKERE